MSCEHTEAIEVERQARQRHRVRKLVLDAQRVQVGEEVPANLREYEAFVSAVDLLKNAGTERGAVRIKHVSTRRAL